MHEAAVARIGEPDGPIGCCNGVVWSVERLAFELVGQNGHGPVIFITHHSTVPMFATDLAAFTVKSVAVGIASRGAILTDVSIVFQPSVLAVVRNIRPHQELPNTVPGRPFGPEESVSNPLDWSVAELQAVKAFIETDDVWIRIPNWQSAGPIITRAGGGEILSANFYGISGLGQTCSHHGGHGSSGGCSNHFAT